MDVKEIGRIIIFHRQKAQLSQKELADLAEIGKTAVFDLEKGNSNFQIETLLKICSILNIELTLNSPLMEEWRENAT